MEGGTNHCKTALKHIYSGSYCVMSVTIFSVKVYMLCECAW